MIMVNGTLEMFITHNLKHTDLLLLLLFLCTGKVKFKDKEKLNLISSVKVC